METINCKFPEFNISPSNLSGNESEAEECFLGHRRLSFEANIRSATLMVVIEKTYQTVLYISVANSHKWKISILQLFFIILIRNSIAKLGS